MMSRLMKCVTAGMVVATVSLVLMVFGSIVFATSRGSTVKIPGLLAARSGKGADLLALSMQAPGLLVWFAGLTAVAAAPLFIARRREAPEFKR